MATGIFVAGYSTVYLPTVQYIFYLAALDVKNNFVAEAKMKELLNSSKHQEFIFFAGRILTKKKILR